MTDFRKQQSRTAARLKKLERCPIPKLRFPDAQWVKPQLKVRVRHLSGSGYVRHGRVRHEFIRQAINEAVERMRPELHAASEAAHQLLEEAKAEDEADFERTVELGYVVDRLANFWGPNLAVLCELTCALDEFHGTDEQETERHRH